MSQNQLLTSEPTHLRGVWENVPLGYVQTDISIESKNILPPYSFQLHPGVAAALQMQRALGKKNVALSSQNVEPGSTLSENTLRFPRTCKQIFLVANFQTSMNQHTLGKVQTVVIRIMQSCLLLL